MRDALEHLTSLHPACYFGRLAHRQSGLAGFGAQGRDWRGGHEHEIARREPIWMIEAAAVLAVFFAVLTAMASFTIDAPDPGQHELTATADPAVAR